MDDVIRQFKNEIIEAPVSRTVEHIIQEQVHGYFYFNDLYRIVQNCTADVTEGAVRQTLKRLAKDGVVEKTKKWGEYRKVETDYEELDFYNSPDEPLRITLPLEITKELGVEVYQKDILGIAGVSNHGKTGWVLRFIDDNMESWNIYYFSHGDMSAQRLKRRIKKFGDDALSRWHKYMKGKTLEIYGAFEDYVRPDAINIFDFMHEGEQPWIVADKMKAIKARLDTGIAIVVLQKNRGAEYGLGKEKGEIYTQLYFTIDTGVAKIKKAKSFAEGYHSPVGKILHFKLVDGCKFIPQGIWHHQDDEETAGYEMYRRKQ